MFKPMTYSEISNFIRRYPFDYYQQFEGEIESFKHVPWDGYAISTSEQPYLFTDGLIICLGLYAVTKEFAFLAHIFTKIEDPRCSLKYNEKTGSYTCHLLNCLSSAIVENVNDKTDLITLGFVKGSMPLGEEDNLMTSLKIETIKLITSLRNSGFAINQNEDIFSTDFILNYVSQEIVSAYPLYNSESKNMGRNVLIKSLRKI